MLGSASMEISSTREHSYIHICDACQKHEEEYMLRQIDEGCVGNHHAGFKDLPKKTLKVGYFWPIISQDAKELVRKYEKWKKKARLIYIPTKELGIMYSPYSLTNGAIT